MNFPPYELYRPPTVPWLGAPPTHWKIRRTKTMLRLQKSQVGRSSADLTLLSLTLGGVIRRNIAEGGKFPAEFDTYQLVQPGDLVFCLFDIDETPRTIGISRDFGMITGAYNVYRALSACIPEYACYYFLHIDSFKGLRPFYTGLRKVVRADTFSKVEMPSPPLDEQTQIARFLDYETARIDALIEKQQQLIALLKEKRQAVISHAVTKGLNPNAPLRDSGVEWLGMVPAHWGIGKCGFYLSILSGYAFPSSGFSTNESDVRLLRGINVSVGAVRWDDVVRWRRRAGDGLSAWELSEGELVVGMDRPMIAEGVRVAKLCADDVPCLLLQRVAALKPSPLLNADYLMCMLSFSKLFEAHFAPETTGVSVPHISPKQISDFVVPVPPRNEQDAIVDWIRESIGRIDNLIRSAGDVVDLLKERRTALISAAVTGKIDVRNWTPPNSNTEQAVA